MDTENIKDQVHRLLGRPIECVEFQQNGKTRFLPIYLSYSALKDASAFAGDTEQECYEKLFIELSNIKNAEDKEANS